MKRLLEYDPLTRTQTWYESDPSGEVVIATLQDDRHIIDWCKKKANDSEYKRQGIKSDWYHCARVPNTVLYEIMNKYGYSPFRSEDHDKILRVVQQEYKLCLTVDKI
jgi:hypothetical protein